MSRDLPSPSARQQFLEAGFLLVEELVEAKVVPDLRAEADALLGEAVGRGGVRNVLDKSPRFRDLAEHGTPARWAVAMLGSAARPTKLTIFDKTARANWRVPWHQDLTIAVAERIDVPGFGPWSVKDGVANVQAPVEVLEELLAIRLHLDDTPGTNGALRVLPGSHRLGRIHETQLESLRGAGEECLCPVMTGGAMLMRPLLLHASNPAAVPGRRRVLHFEYSAAPLPGGLVWA